MLSRRIVRVKVMQVLYSMSRDQSLKMSDALARYKQSVSKTFELYIYNLYIMLKVAEFSEKDAENRGNKLRPTDEDRNFKAKLAQNKFTQSLVTHHELKKFIIKYNLEANLDVDHIKTLYSEFAKTDEYKIYVAKDIKAEEEHVTMLLSLYRFCIANELFNDILEDYHYNWEDDKSLVMGAMKKTLKALPAEDTFYKEFVPDQEVVKDFGDMILLKMAICEMLDFKSIPTKVTLNEFVEISKIYSTDKSKEFVNGILDRLLKKLEKDGQIVKEGRGLIDS